MSDQNKFEIKLGIDRTDQQQASAAAVAEFREMEDAAKRSAQGQEDALKAVARAHEPIQDDLKREIDLMIRQAHESRELTDATRTHGRESAASIALWQRGLDMALDTVRAFPEAFDKAADARKRYTQGFADTREGLRELATIEGVKATNAYTLGIEQEARDVGLQKAQYIEYRKALQGSGQQFVGTNFSQKEASEFIHQSAQLAAARKLSPETAGSLAGALMGFTDYQAKYGDNASEAVTGQLNTLLAVTGAGRGSDQENADQMARIFAAMANEDAMKGVFTKPVDVAIAESTMAEFEPGRAFTGIKAASRALQGANPASKEILQEAGITPMTPFLQAVEKLAPVVQAETQKLHVPMETVLRQNFKDEEAVTALSTLINKGVYQGVFAQRRGVAAQNQGFAPVEAQVSSYQASAAYWQTFADVNKELAEAKRGAKFEDIEIVNKLALANLIDRGVLNSSQDNIKKALISNFSGGFLSDQDRRQLVAERHRMEAEQRQRLHLAPAVAPDTETFSGTVAAVGRSMLGMAGVELAVPEMTAAGEQANFRQIRTKLGIDPIAEMVAHEGVEVGGQGGNGNGAAERTAQATEAMAKALQKKQQRPMVLRQPVPGGGRPEVNR